MPCTGRRRAGADDGLRAAGSRGLRIAGGSFRRTAGCVGSARGFTSRGCRVRGCSARGCSVRGCSVRGSAVRGFVSRTSGRLGSGRAFGSEEERSSPVRGVLAGARLVAGAGADVSRVRSGLRLGGVSPSFRVAPSRTASLAFPLSFTRGSSPGTRAGARPPPPSPTSFPNTTLALGGRRRMAVEQSVGAGCRAAGTPSIQIRHMPGGGR